MTNFVIRRAEAGKPAVSASVANSATPGITTLKIASGETYSSLFVSSGALPEGLCFKAVNSIDEAKALGGIILFDPIDPTTYVFYVGRTFDAAWDNNLLGMCVGLTDRQTEKPMTFVDRPDFSGRIFGYRDGAYRGERAVLVEFTCPGGEMIPNLRYFDVFAERSICALGIVTSATDGHGLGKYTGWKPPAAMFGPGAVNVNTAHGYVLSEVALDATFGAFMSKFGVVSSSAAPTAVRDAYTSSMADSLAVYSRAGEKPTVAIPSYWVGPVLSDRAPARSAPFFTRLSQTSEQTGADMSAFSAALMSDSSWTIESNWSGMVETPIMDPGYSARVNDITFPDLLWENADGNPVPFVNNRYNYVNTIQIAVNRCFPHPESDYGNLWRGAPTVVVRRPLVRLNIYPGVVGHWVDSVAQVLPFVCSFSATTASTGVAHWVGKPSGFPVGDIRDGQLVGRSLQVQKADLFANKTATASLAELVGELLTSDEYRVGRAAATIDESSNAAVETAFTSAFGKGHDWRGLRYPGSLVVMLDEFDEIWDANAKASLKA